MGAKRIKGEERREDGRVGGERDERRRGREGGERVAVAVAYWLQSLIEKECWWGRQSARIISQHLEVYVE